jgi:hypothetical protein
MSNARGGITNDESTVMGLEVYGKYDKQWCSTVCTHRYI